MKMADGRKEQDAGGGGLEPWDGRKELTFVMVGAPFRQAHIQEPRGHSVDGGVDFVGDVLGVAPIETALRGVQPFP